MRFSLLKKRKDGLVDLVWSLPHRDVTTFFNHAKLRACDGLMEGCLHRFAFVVSKFTEIPVRTKGVAYLPYGFPSGQSLNLSTLMKRIRDQGGMPGDLVKVGIFVEQGEIIIYSHGCDQGIDRRSCYPFPSQIKGQFG